MPAHPTDHRRLRIEFLGTGRVVSEHGEQVLPPGIPLTVFAYLYASPEGRTRDALSEAFWPGKERWRGLQSLRQTLSRIRRVVGDHRIVTEGRVVLLRRELFDSDLASFERAIREGDALGAMDLWKGGFLTEARHPECWEVENWLERERSRLRGTLRATILAAAEGADPRDEVDQTLLSLMDRACQQFPLDERLHQLRFDLNLRSGFLARAAGILAEIQAEGDLSLPTESMARALDEARAAADTRLDLDPTFTGFPEGRGRQVASWTRLPVAALPLAAAALLLVVLTILGWSGSRVPREADLADHVMLFCSTAATFRMGDQEIHLFRMDLDGRNKQRISDVSGCAFVWLEQQASLLLVSHPRQALQFIRLSPRANPLTEWESVALQSLPVGFRAVYPLGFQGGPSEAAGRYGVFIGENDAGASALFLVDPVADSIRQITPLGRDFGSPVWDAAREEIIFGATLDDQTGLWALAMRDPEASPVQLTRSPSKDNRPAISGDLVVFVRGFGTGPTEGDYALHLLNRATGEDEVLVSRPWNDFMVRWSPNGKHLCWTSEEFGHFESDIWVMELRSRKMRNLTAELSGRNYECQWAPDNRTVFFASTHTGRAQIYRALRNGRFLENVSRMEADAEPGWVLPRDIYARFVP